MLAPVRICVSMAALHAVLSLRMKAKARRDLASSRSVDIQEAIADSITQPSGNSRVWQRDASSRNWHTDVQRAHAEARSAGRCLCCSTLPMHSTTKPRRPVPCRVAHPGEPGGGGSLIVVRRRDWEAARPRRRRGWRRDALRRVAAAATVHGRVVVQCAAVSSLLAPACKADHPPCMQPKVVGSNSSVFSASMARVQHGKA